MNPSLYDLLDVEPTADNGVIRAAWKAAIADLDPTDRRFRAYNQAAEVLLDPHRRAAHDAELAAQPEPQPGPGSEPWPEPGTGPGHATPAFAPSASSRPAGARGAPTWLLLLLAVLTLGVVATTAYVATMPSDTSVGESTREAQTAAERAIGPILSYDYRHLEEDQAAAHELMTSEYRTDYDSLFEVVKQNAPRAEAVVSVEVLASAVVRSGTDRAEVLVFLDRPTTNVKNRQPVVYKDQVRVQVERVDEEWLVDCLITTPNGTCD